MKFRNPLDLRSVEQCHKCVTLGRRHVPSCGDPSSDVMIVGQSPGKVEVEMGRPFIGPSGEVLEFLLDEAGLSREDVYMTNVLKCNPPNNRFAHPVERLNCYKEWLLPELMAVNPKIVLLLGKDAHTTLLPPKFAFGHNIITRNPKSKRIYLTSYHPAYFLRNHSRIPDFVAVGATLRELLDEG